MSSVFGGKAVRGAFTGALARQIAKADGKTYLNDMVTNAFIDMKKQEADRYPGTLEPRNTLQKSLVLPPGMMKPHSQQAQAKLSKLSLLRRLGVL